MTRPLVALLLQLYNEAEAFRWLTSRQPMLEGATPLDFIAQGRTDDLILMLRSIVDGNYA